MKPASTYRLQFNAGFRFGDARRLVPYLHALGITHIYASPVFRSRRGSLHGYDVVDPTRIEPALGGNRGFDALVRELRRHGMALIIDIVPNHMAISDENPWWRDVALHGEQSRYARFFDIDWAAGEGRVVLPVLPAPGPDQVEHHTRRVYWRTGLERLNYRRFFDVSDLIGVRVEDDDVFEKVHELTVRLRREGKIDGVRVDHIDGLWDPQRYLARLRRRLGAGTYIVVEKILGRDEALPAWPVEGATGYRFLDALNGIFVDPGGLKALSAYFGGRDFQTLAYEKKKLVLSTLFKREVRSLAHEDQRGALIDLTACLPVYRTYVRDHRLDARDRRVIEQAFRLARTRTREDLRPLRRMFQMEKRRPGDLDFVMRWQQLTGPAMAKGVEDTVLYLYNRLISLNVVGGECLPSTIGEFHHVNRARRASLNATSTHDTKRSEDVRARIDVLSELADEWRRLSTPWVRRAPDRTLGHLFYQTLIGVWPLDAAEIPGLRDRLFDYLVKAAREGKERTNWLEPDARFEARLAALVDGAFTPAFQKRFLPFQQRVAFHGAMNSLSQLVLKIASPGVPDFYQGTELWDFSLVDPDNRRPVDFTARRQMLRGIDAASADALLSRWQDGGIKMYVTRRALRFRRAQRILFEQGDYIPLRVVGPKARHVVAFARRRGSAWVVAVVPRWTASLVSAGEFPGGKRVWASTKLVVPRGAPTRWQNVLTDEPHDSPLEMASVFRTLPVALLRGRAR